MAVVQSVARAFTILEALRAGPVSLSEIAREVDLPISTASRLLNTLEKIGAAERLENANLYRIGPGIVTMATGVDSTRSLVALTEVELEHLANQSGEAVGLSVASGYTVHFIAEQRADVAVQLRDWVDTRLPMHLTAPGLVALASWPEEAVDNYLSRDLASPTKNSMTDPDALRGRIAQIRVQGVAWTVDELEVGITSLAAPLIARTGEVVGGINIHGPSFRFPGNRVQEFETMIRSAAERINLILA